MGWTGLDWTGLDWPGLDRRGVRQGVSKNVPPKTLQRGYSLPSGTLKPTPEVFPNPPNTPPRPPETRLRSKKCSELASECDLLKTSLHFRTIFSLAWRPKSFQNGLHNVNKSMWKNNISSTSIIDESKHYFGVVLGWFFEGKVCENCNGVIPAKTLKIVILPR